MASQQLATPNPSAASAPTTSAATSSRVAKRPRIAFVRAVSGSDASSGGVSVRGEVGSVAAPRVAFEEEGQRARFGAASAFATALVVACLSRRRTLVPSSTFASASAGKEAAAHVR